MASRKTTLIAYAAEGKNYVISAIGSVQFGGNSLCGGRTIGLRLGGGDLISSVKVFKWCDPVEKKWKVLQDSPWRCLSYLAGYLLLEVQQKMLLTAWSNGHLIHILNDFYQDTWLSSSLLPSSQTNHLLKSVNKRSRRGGFCYGPFNLKKDEEEDDPANVTYLPCSLSILRTSHMLPGVWILLVCCSIRAISRLFLLFCQALIDDVYTPEPHTSNVFIIIFKEVKAEKVKPQAVEFTIRLLIIYVWQWHPSLLGSKLFKLIEEPFSIDCLALSRLKRF